MRNCSKNSEGENLVENLPIIKPLKYELAFSVNDNRLRVIHNV